MADNTTTQNLSGQIIDNKYELIAPLGEGGMSVVYKARRLRINDEVAVKILHAEVTADAVSQIRFEREAQAAARIKHPNIVTIHDFGTTTSGLTYLVMEMLQGPTLSEELSNYNGLAVERFIDIFLPVCRAIGAAHQEGIIHRDLKPSNILLHKLKDGTELVKVVDFGIVKVRAGEALTQVNNILGTPHYMSPEQCYSRELDARSDIYSLAIIAYEMLTGRLPFNESSIIEILQAHVEKTPPSLRQFRPNIPMDLEAVILRALSKTADERPNSAQEFGQELLTNSGIGHLRTTNTGAHSKNRVSSADLSPIQNNRTEPVTPLRLDTISRRLVKVNPDFNNFVGRKKELERLIAEYQNLLAGKARPVVVLGEKGVGLSQLGEEFTKWLKKQNIPVLLTKFYEPTSRAQLPFQPWLDLLRRIFNVRRQSLSQESDLIPIVAEKTGITLPEYIFEGRSLDESEKWSVFESLANTISSTIQIGALIFDSLEYAHVNLEFLSYLIRNFPSQTLFVFLVNSEKATQKGHPCQEWLVSLSRSGGYETIKLTPLSQAELRNMLDGIFGRLEIIERDVERIWEVSRGNPYYVVEVVRYLINERKITLSAEAWHCENIKDFVLPESLQQLAEIKLGQTSQDTLDILRQAAIIGQQFTFDLLEKFTGLSEDTLIDSLEKAIKARILQETESKEEEYLFTDPTVQFVLYEATPKRRRRKLHLQVAKAIEDLVKNNQQKLLRHSTALLHHYYESGEIEKTFYYGRLAAEAALSRQDVVEAEKYYNWALNAASEMQEEGNPPNLEEQAQLYLGSARIALHLGQIEKAQQDLAKAQQLTKFEQNQTIICHSNLIKSQIEYYLSNFEQAREATEIGLKAARSLGDTKLESQLSLMLAQILTALGKTEETLNILEANLTIARQQKVISTENQILSLLGSTYGLTGKFKQGFILVEQALKMAHNNKDRFGELTALRRMGQLYLQTMQLDKALEAFDCGLELAYILEAKIDEAIFENGRGDVYRYLSELDAARECYEKLLNIANSMDNVGAKTLANHNLGLVSLELGIYHDALRKLEKALEEHNKLGQNRLMAEAYCALAYTNEQLGQVEAAQQNYQIAIELCQRIIHPTYKWQAHYGLANTFWMFGQMDEALKELEKAKEIIQELCDNLPDNIDLTEFMRDKLKVQALIEDIEASTQENF